MLTLYNADISWEKEAWKHYENTHKAFRRFYYCCRNRSNCRCNRPLQQSNAHGRIIRNVSYERNRIKHRVGIDFTLYLEAKQQKGSLEVDKVLDNIKASINIQNKLTAGTRMRGLKGISVLHHVPVAIFTS